MASGKLFKRGEKWYIDVHTGRKVNGKYERIQRKANGRTKAEAQAELDELMYELRQALKTGGAVNNVFPLYTVGEDWCAHIQRTVANTETASEYCRHVRRMITVLGIESVSDLTLDATEEAMATIAQEKSTSTANKCLAKLKAALEYAKKRGRIVSNPIKDAKQMHLVRKKFRRALTEQEVQMLLKTAPEPWRTVWHFFLATGMRRDELLKLRRSDVDLQQGRVKITEREGFKPKTRAGIRTIPLNEQILSALKKLNSNGTDLLFTYNGGRPVTTWALIIFRRHITEALKQLAEFNRSQNLPPPENVFEVDGEFRVNTKTLDLHSLRYTFITELISKGVDPKTVQYLAGHKDIKTTLGIYAQCRGGNVENATQVLPW